MVRARKGDTVRVHYEAKLGDDVYDSSVEDKPVRLTLGAGRVMEGFEEAIVGMEPGERKTTRIPPEKAYGRHDDAKVVTVERRHLPEDIEPEIGQLLKARRPDGRTEMARVVDVSGSMVTIDINHPMAGKEITIEIELVEVL